MRDLFNKIRHNKGTFHAKRDTIKDKNGIDLTETDHFEVTRIHRKTTEKIF